MGLRLRKRDCLIGRYVFITLEFGYLEFPQLLSQANTSTKTCHIHLPFLGSHKLR